LLGWLAECARASGLLDHEAAAGGAWRGPALRFAIALGWLCERDAAATALAAALRRARAGQPEGATAARQVGAALAEIGGALGGRVGDGLDGWLGAGALAAFAAVDARAITCLAALTGQPERAAAKVEATRAAISYERLAVLEAVVGLVRADAVVDGRERRLVQLTLAAAGADAGERRLVERMLRAGGADLDGLAAALPSPGAQRRLLRLLEVASLADGEAEARELAWIAAVADALGAGPAPRLEVHAEVLASFAATPRLPELLGRPGLGEAAARRTERQVRALVAAHLKAITGELRETGDLMGLLAASTTRPLSAAEQARLRAQLLDLCRTVPALAIFAAPGGTLLLPILARVLPFSLAPSRFREPGL
jgi:uncharacterized membrane protein YebE (DUF533 family)